MRPTRIEEAWTVEGLVYDLAHAIHSDLFQDVLLAEVDGEVIGYSRVMWWRELKDPNFDPTLWQVAWDGKQVVGMALAFVNEREKAKYGRRRGGTEGTCVRRPWRRQGLARALLVRSLQALREPAWLRSP